MNLFERMLRQQMRQQLLYGRRRPRAGYGFGRPYGYGWGRPRSRGNVRVGGCCLPIPLAVVAAGTLGVRVGIKRPRA